MIGDHTSLASIFNLGGPDLIIIVVILAFWVAVIGGIVLLVRFLTRRNSTGEANTSTPQTRLEQIQALRSSGAINDLEYEEQRKRILSEV